MINIDLKPDVIITKGLIVDNLIHTGVQPMSELIKRQLNI